MRDAPLRLRAKYAHRLHIQTLRSSCSSHFPSYLPCGDFLLQSTGQLLQQKFIITCLNGEIMQPAPPKHTVWASVKKGASVSIYPCRACGRRGDGGSWWIRHCTTLHAQLLISCLKPTAEQRSGEKTLFCSVFVTVAFFPPLLILRRGDPRTLIRAGFKTADTCFKKAVTQAKKNQNTVIHHLFYHCTVSKQKATAHGRSLNPVSETSAFSRFSAFFLKISNDAWQNRNEDLFSTLSMHTGLQECWIFTCTLLSQHLVF